MFYSIKITEEMINEAETELNEKGVFVKCYSIEIYSKTNVLHAIAKTKYI
jgi:hypothetical protein